MIERRIGSARIWCTDRRGGVSAPPFDTANLSFETGDRPEDVAENRRRVGAAIGPPARDPARWLWLRQVHGTGVVVARSAGDPPAEAGSEADAAVTDVAGLSLVVLTADCAPVALVGRGAIGAVHVGWRGLLAGVLERSVAALAELAPGPIRAVVGPCIRPARYAFGVDDLERVAAAVGPEVRAETVDGRPALDLPAGVRVALRRCGVDRIDDTGVCTHDSADHFSHRRDGTTGRQALVVTIER